MAKEGEPDVPSCQVAECTLPVDIVIQTSDGKYFGTHLQNLESYAEGFPPASLGKRKRVNHMVIEEHSDVTSLMVQFMHKQPQPDLRQVPIKVLVDLAEAAEKYLIYSAMNVCRICLGNRAPELPLEILAYALKHDYPEIADNAAPHSLGMSWKDVQNELGTGVTDVNVLIWDEYREPFLSLVKDHAIKELRFHPPYEREPRCCQVYEDFQRCVLEDLLNTPGNILSPNWSVKWMGIVRGKRSYEGCALCCEGFQEWLQDIITKASSFP